MGKGSNIKYVRMNKPEKEPVKVKPQDVGEVAFGVAFSILYIGVASNFYNNLVHFEEITRDNCTMRHSMSLEEDLNTFCNHFVVWKICAIFGIAIPGCLYTVLGLIRLHVLFKNKDTALPNFVTATTCRYLWQAFDFLAKLVSWTVLYLLPNTMKDSDGIGDASGVIRAAIIYLLVVLLELTVYALVLGCLILYACLRCALVCVPGCCILLFRCFVRKETPCENCVKEIVTLHV